MGFFDSYHFGSATGTASLGTEPARPTIAASTTTLSWEATPNVSSYLIQRTEEEFGLAGWETISSTVTESFDFEDYILTKGMYLRVVAITASGEVVIYPVTYYDRVYGSADPASLSVTNIETSFRVLVQSRLVAMTSELDWYDHTPGGPGMRRLRMDNARIDYDNADFDAERLREGGGTVAWIAIRRGSSSGTNEFFMEIQVTCFAREPGDRKGQLPRLLADLVESRLNVASGSISDYTTPTAPVLVSCGMSGVPLKFASRCVARSPVLEDRDSKTKYVALTYRLAAYREAAIP